LFVPWLVKGGADQYAVNYANTIAKLHPNKRVLVIATLPVQSIWKDKLHASVDFIDFGLITEGISIEIKHRIIGHLIENGSTTHIHILNSEFGYEFTLLHEKYIKATKKVVIATSFSQSIDDDGRIYGYSHTHVPLIYDIASYITSDNIAVTQMWKNEYGFDDKKLLVHRQPINTEATENIINKETSNDSPLTLLWAARIAPEKQPGLISKIGQLTSNKAIIHMYGSVDEDSRQYIDNLPNNVVYKGPFDGLASLPLHTYDALLYTSLFDGMPNTILEAAQSKLPIIASEVGGIPEFITEKTGLLIADIKNPQAYSDAITALAKDRSLGPLLAEGAFDKLKTEFSADKYNKDIADFLEAINY
jgi:glycosyltransferase involved in cell wall biosynthesis